jgi:proline iminopeptidase
MGTNSIGRRAAIPPASPALVLHGGPGSGCSAGSRRPFDPDVYRIVLFDQRGSGSSAPHASDPNIDLSTNTTAHLLADIELLRRRLDIERWPVFGGSWGSQSSTTGGRRIIGGTGYREKR